MVTIGSSSSSSAVSGEADYATMDLEAFFHAAIEFFLIPCNAIEIKLPAVPGLPSVQWQVWKGKLEKFPRKLLDCKMRLMAFFDSSFWKLKIKGAVSEKEREKAVALSGEGDDEGEKDWNQKLWERWALEAWWGVKIIPYVYAVYLLASIDQYEQVSSKGDTLLRRLDGKLEGCSSEYYNALLSHM